MNVVMGLAVALAPVFAAWATAAGVASIITTRADLSRSAWRGLVAATACATIGTVGLVVALVSGDLSVTFVSERFSVLVPTRYVASALLSAPGGALLAFAACTGAAGLLGGRTATGAARTWTVTTIAGALLVPLLIVAVLASPFAAHAIRTDGAGLSPDLQRGAAVLHAVMLLLATACATVSCALTIAAVATLGINDAWSRHARVWNALTWTALFVGIVAGARWYAFNPVRGAWIEAPATALWLLPCVAGAWLVHLDTGSQVPARVVTRILLSAGVFVAMIVAVAFSNGAFINGIAAASDRAGMLVSIVPALALATLITRLRRSAGLLKKSGSLRPIAKARIAGWVAHAGVVLLLAAAIASRFTRTHTVTLGDAEIFRAKDQFGHQWQFSSQGVSTLQRENYASFTVSLLPERDEQRLGMISAEARSYGLASGSESGAPAFITGKLGGPFMETRLTIMAPDGKRPTLRVEFVPLATWVVVAAALVALGTLLSLVPPRDEGIA